MNHAYLLIGGNTGDRPATLQKACVLIEERCGKILRRSSLYRTAAWGFTDQPDFYNQCLFIETKLSAAELMQMLLHIETGMGRVRTQKMGPRIIDLDILFFNTEIIDTDILQVPHPRLHLRKFVLIPLAEIAPDLIHPTLNKSVSQMLHDCNDELDVHKI